MIAEKNNKAFKLFKEDKFLFKNKLYIFQNADWKK